MGLQLYLNPATLNDTAFCVESQYKAKVIEFRPILSATKMQFPKST